MSNVRSTSLCTFTFSDGRRCRTLRQSGHPLFCSFHARRQDRSNSAETLGREFAHFFSGKYLSACDLNTALAKLFTATVRGHVPPKTTRTLAYLAQVMVQCIHLTGNEYSGAFGGDGWRNSIRSSVNANSGSAPTQSPAAPPPAFQDPVRDPSASAPSLAGPRPGSTATTLKSQLKQLLISEIAAANPEPPQSTAPPQAQAPIRSADPASSAAFTPPAAATPGNSDLPIGALHQPPTTEFAPASFPSATPPSNNVTPATNSPCSNPESDSDDDGDSESLVVTPAMRRRQWSLRV